MVAQAYLDPWEALTAPSPTVSQHITNRKLIHIKFNRLLFLCKELECKIHTKNINKYLSCENNDHELLCNVSLSASCCVYSHLKPAANKKHFICISIGILNKIQLKTVRRMTDSLWIVIGPIQRESMEF